MNEIEFVNGDYNYYRNMSMIVSIPKITQIKSQCFSMAKRRPIAICFITSAAVNESFGGVQNFVLQFSRWLAKKSIKTMVVSNSYKAFVKDILFKKVNGGIEMIEVKKGETSWAKYFPSIVRSIIFVISSFLEIIYYNKKFNFSIIHAQDIFTSGLSGVMVHKLLRIPLIVHCHGPSPYFFEGDLETTNLKRYLAKFIAILVGNNSDLLIFTDMYTRSLFQSFIGKAKNICIPTPINIRELLEKKKKCTKKLSKECLFLGFTGRLSFQKNLRTLLNAFALARKNLSRPLKLFVVGDGPEKDFLEHEAKRLEVDKDIIFTGAVSEEEKIKLLNSFDIFLMPSFYEGCPISLLEAMAFGKAIISSNIPSIRKIINDSEEAVLVNPHDVNELKQAIMLLCRNYHLRLKLSRNAEAKAHLYDIEIIFKKYLGIYGKLLVKRHFCHT